MARAGGERAENTSESTGDRTARGRAADRQHIMQRGAQETLLARERSRAAAVAANRAVELQRTERERIR